MTEQQTKCSRCGKRLSVLEPNARDYCNACATFLNEDDDELIEASR